MKKETTKTKKTSHTETKTVRIDSKLCDFINSELSTINSKKKGSRSVKISEYLWLAVKKVSEDDRQQLLDATMTSFDLFELGFKRFKKENRKASKEQFMSKIATGKIILCDYVIEGSDAKCSKSSCYESRLI